MFVQIVSSLPAVQSHRKTPNMQYAEHQVYQMGSFYPSPPRSVLPEGTAFALVPNLCLLGNGSPSRCASTGLCPLLHCNAGPHLCLPPGANHTSHSAKKNNSNNVQVPSTGALSHYCQARQTPHVVPLCLSLSLTLSPPSRIYGQQNAIPSQLIHACQFTGLSVPNIHSSPAS